ncbi:MAG: ATP phosphoribosyltransferase regulatory subunit [Pseudomonadota bacterium]
MEPEFANQGSAPARLEAGAAYAPARDYSGVALERLNQVNIELTNIFNDAGFQPIEPGMLQPAEPLFDLYGEEIWDRAFVVEDEARADGDGTLCLRPDFTVPVARAHLAAGGGTGRYGYFGPVFRRSPPGENQPLQHLQAGIEIIGSADAAAADAEAFDLARKALEWAGVQNYRVVTGDLSIIFSVLEAVAMPDSWRRRLKRHFWRPERFRRVLARFAGEEPADGAIHAERLAFLKAVGGLAPGEAAAAVAEMISLSDTPQIGKRSAKEVAERFLRQAADAREHPLPRESVDLINAVLDIKGTCPQALMRLRELRGSAFAPNSGADLEASVDRFAARLDELAARGVDVENLPFDASFGRNLEYYDGFVFEMAAPSHEPGAGEVKLGGGGRYDHLFKALRASAPIPSVGAALRPEAMVAAGAGGGR